MTFPFPETASIVTRTVTGQDSDGGDVRGTVETLTSGAFAPEGSTELVQGQVLVSTVPKFYLDANAPTPAPTDQLRVRGVVYDIDGAPKEYHNPFTGNEPGPVLQLKRVTG